TPILPPPVWHAARARQPIQVQSDPKYICDTGTGFGCPQCGSSNITAIGKPGLPFWVIGTWSTVIVYAVADFAVAAMQR
ncbi:hypothetical protein ACSTJB_23565, partial [Vibrio parahaemolyticus]